MFINVMQEISKGVKLISTSKWRKIKTKTSNMKVYGVEQIHLILTTFLPSRWFYF